MSLIIDGYRHGLAATLWTAGAIVGTLTVTAPWGLGAVLIHRSWRTITTTRTAWRLRARLSTRRLRRSA